MSYDCSQGECFRSVCPKCHEYKGTHFCQLCFDTWCDFCNFGNVDKHFCGNCEDFLDDKGSNPFVKHALSKRGSKAVQKYIKEQKKNESKCPTCGAIKMARMKLDISDEAILLGCKEGFFELALSKKGSKWIKQYLKEKEREQAK